MKFIFPKNYNFNVKLLGFIDYQIAIINVIIWIITYFIINLLFTDFYFKTVLFITFCFPILLFTIIGFNNENILYVFSYLYNFFKSKKIYLFYK